MLMMSVVALGLCACSRAAQVESAPAGVVLRVEPESPDAGERVSLVLENGSGGTVGYNLCTSALERERGGAWTPLPSDRVCTMELRTLQPGQSDRYPLELPAGMEAGRYRFSTGIERMDAGTRESVSTEPFEVDG